MSRGRLGAVALGLGMVLMSAAGASAAETVWLDELDLSGMKQDVGTPGVRAGFGGKMLSVAGIRFARGVGTHARSSLTLALNGRALRFLAQVGVDDGEKTHPGSVEFQVIADGRVAWRSGVVRGGEPPRAVDVDLTGVQRLELRVTDGGDGIDSDHADWGQARFVVREPLADLFPPGIAGPVPAAEWNRLSPKQAAAGMTLKQVAPGLWRLRVGKPERFTPTAFRAAPAKTEALAKMPAVERLPFRPADVRFHVQARGCTVELPMAAGEQIFGFGLNLRLFNMTGRRVVIRTSDAPETEQNDSHAPVPFYVSSEGYGVYVDTARYASFYSGNVALCESATAGPKEPAGIATSTEELYRARALSSKRMVVDVPVAQGVDVYLFAGPSALEAVQRYNLFSGGGCLPPLWGLGVHYRGLGSFTAEETTKLAQSLRDTHLPCDIWGLEPGWQSQAYSCSFTWSKERFPDPNAFVAKMRAMGYHLSAWEHAFTHPTSPLFEAMKPHSGSYLVWNGLVPDFADPEARRLFEEHHDRTLVQKGVDVFKLDECDNQPLSPTPWSWPECSAFPSGLDGEQMHALLGPLYQQTLLEVLKRHNLRTYGLARAGHALAGPLPYAIYSDAYGDRDYVRALAKCGFSGILWTPEVRDARSVEELFRRMQAVILSPQAVINCWYMRNPPWLQIDRDKSNRGELMPDHEKVTDGIRRLLQLRMRLIPYLYAAFAEYREHGTPPFRALALDYPQDANTWSLDDEFLVGPSLLAAPLFAGESKRSVYLPEGEWIDFWTHERFAGGRKVEISKGLEQFPLFVKAGSLLPLAEPVEHVAPDTCFAVTVHVFGADPAPFTLYEDDGTTWDFEKGKQNRVELRWTPAGGQVRRTGGYAGRRYDVVGWEPVAVQ